MRGRTFIPFRRIVVAITLGVAVVFGVVPSAHNSGNYSSARRISIANFQGFLDVADCNSVAGWAADLTRLNTSINVQIFDGSTLLKTLLANLSRTDVGTAIGDNGLHGFQFALPTALHDGRSHSIRVIFETTTTELTNSPRTITCAAEVQPPENSASADRLNLSFRLNQGASSTTNRTVNLSFTATKQTTTTSTDITRGITHYRVREAPGTQDVLFTDEPWIAYTPSRASITFDLAVKTGGQRYGERHVMFQVKTDTLTSNVVGDSIVLDPELKDYVVGSTGNDQPLIQYAASQGFSFPLDYYETCDGGRCVVGDFKADLNIASGHAEAAVQQTFGKSISICFVVSGLVIGVGPCIVDTAVPVGTCRTKADYLLFQTRKPNKFWHIKSVAANGNVVFHGQDEFRLKYRFDNSSGCFGPQPITIGDVVVTGPVVDDFVDPANPWKNAFVRPSISPFPSPRN